MLKSCTNAHRMSRHAAGDEVLFKFEGLLLGTVERVRFDGRKVRYRVTLDLECEVPEASVIGQADALVTPVPADEGASDKAPTPPPLGLVADR